MTWTRVPIALLLLLVASPALAETLDLDAVLHLAREHAAAARIARVEQDVAAGELRTARTWRHNPELELEAGPRDGPDGRSWDRSVGLSQRLDLAGRGARGDAARATLAAARDQSRATGIAVAARAARLYLEALHAAQRRQLASDATDLHDRLLEIARRRHEAGETGRLDVHQATVGASRARMRLATAEADERHVLAELASLLALEPGHPLAVTGDLAWSAPGDATAVRAAVARHPEIAALEARRRAASARVRLAGAARWPDVGLGARVGREEQADIVHVGVSLGLPLFARGQGEREAARAVDRIAEIQHDAARRARLDHALRAWERYQDLHDALTRATATTTDALAGSSRLAAESYRLGEIALDRVLLVERENLEARNALNDLRLATALAALEVAEIAALPPLANPTEESR